MEIICRIPEGRLKLQGQPCALERGASVGAGPKGILRLCGAIFLASNLNFRF